MYVADQLCADVPIDSGISSLALIAEFLGISVDEAQLRHRLGLGSRNATSGELVRAARFLELKSRLTAPRTLDPRLPCPAIAQLKDGNFCILGRVTEDCVLIKHPGDVPVEILSRDAFRALWDGSLILLTRRAADARASQRFGLKWFVPAIGRYKRILAEVWIGSLVLQLLGLASPVFFQVVIDKVLVHRGFATLQVMVIALTAIGAFEGLLTFLRNYIFAHTTNRIDVELGARLYRHLLALPLPYFGARRVGDSVARVRELEHIRAFVTGTALTVAIDLLFTIVFMAVMLVYSTTLTLIVAGSIPVFAILSLILTPMFRARLEEKFNRGAESQAFLVESITGIETLKAMAVEPQMQQRWEQNLAAYVGASFRAQTLGNAATEFVDLVNHLVTAAILFFGARAVINGEMTVGELVAFNMMAGRVTSPVLRLAQTWQDFHQTRVSIDRLGDILDTPIETGAPGAGAGGSIGGPIAGHIRFEAVTFRYRPDAAPVLDEIELDIAAGQFIGIVGASGSGKSTLAKLVQRFYIPERGRVYVDGLDVALVDPAWLRRQIGVVLQDNVLFNRSVRENIALADPVMPFGRVVEAAKLAGAHDFITELPHGYDTVLGERGNSLSGGQRQRVAIARALACDPPVLIFDEATSALDYESERVIRANMQAICRGRTVLVIAHRLSTVRAADRILTLDQGRIVEDGTHDMLLRRGGRYARLHRLQSGALEDA